MERDYVCIIGGCNVDIQGFPSGKLNMRDSTPGSVKVSLGGVGRNIGENLARMGVKTRLISAVGDDANGHRVIEESKASGIIMDDTVVVRGSNTSTYLSILNESGDMEVAISDMDIYEKIEIGFIDSKKSIIEGSTLCIIDTNIPEDIINHVVTHFINTRFFLDTVSTSKAYKARDIIGYFHTIKPNVMEAEVLWGNRIKSEDDLKRAGEYFINSGVKRVFISLGPKGVYYHDEYVNGILPSPQVKVVNATGAGDAFVAGLAYSFINGFDTIKSAKFAMGSSILALSHDNTINPHMSVENVRKMMMEAGLC